jgi:hypothetical protein
VAAALVGHEPDQAEALVREGLALAQALELRPAEAHALRVLGDIQVGSHSKAPGSAGG